MAFSPGRGGATILLNVDGASASTRDIDTVGDALRRLDRNSLRSVDGELSSVQATVGELAGTVVSFAAASLSIGAFVVTVNSGIDALAELDDMAQKTGSSVENLSRLQKVAQMTEQEFGAVDSAISKLARGMGGLNIDSNKVLSALDRLGVSAKDTAGNMRDPSEVFVDASRALQQYTDGAGKAKLANDLLSKGGEDLLPFMNDVAENIDKVTGASAASAARASQFKDNLGVLKMRLGEVGMSITEAVLPYLVRLSEYVQDLADSGKFKEWADSAISAVDRIASTIDRAASILVPAAKISAAYFVTFVGAPALIAATSAALVTLYGVAGRVVVGFMAGAGAAGIFNTSLLGTSVSAQLASGALTKLKLAASLLFAAFAGWEIGTYLREQFAEVRVAGLSFIGAIMTGWENMKYAAQVAWEAIGFAWDVTVGKMKLGFAAYLEIVQKGLSKVGATDRAAELGRYVDTLRSAAAGQKTFEQRIAGTRAAHETELRAIEANVTELVAWEMGLKSVAKAKEKAAAAGGTKTLGAVDPEAKQKAEDAAKAIATAYEARQKMEAEYASSLAKTVEEANKEALANEELVRTFGLTKQAVAELEIARMEARLEQMRSIDGAQDEVAALELIIAAKKRSAVAIGTLGQLEAGTDVARARDLLDVLSAVDDAAREAAAGMTASFGSVGQAIGGLTTALTGYARQQGAIAAQLKVSIKDAGGDTTKIQRANADAAQQSAQAQIRSYGNMASAAKGFFKENSSGYRALEGAEKAFRAYEMAMAIQTMAVKSGLVANFTALFVAGKATETAATVASVAPDVAASMVKGTAAAAAGVAAQAQGDPYTAWIRMAAMAATMAALGFAVSGGGRGSSGQSAEEVQKLQGTGSVFGDSGAKSNSIARAIELTQKNSSIELTHTAGMLASLRAIEKSMAGFTNLVLQTTGVVDGSNFNIQEGTIKAGVGGLLGKLLGPIGGLWGKTTQTITDSGIQFGGTVNALQSGAGYEQYANVETKKTSAFGLKKKTSNSLQTQSLGADLSSQFALIFTDLEKSLRQAAVTVGASGDEVSGALDRLKIDKTKLSLKGLTGDALTGAINAVISKTMDQMAQAALPAFAQFRQVGEGYAETVMRVTANYANLDSIMESIGSTFGATGITSLVARERLIDLAGGIDSLAAQASGFAENFLTEAERVAPVQRYVTAELAKMGLAGITTRDQFKAIVMGIDKTTAAGAAQYTQMLSLADAFAKAYAASEDLTKSAQAIADERKDLLEELDNLTMTSAQLLNKQRLALDASNRSLFDQVQAAKAVKEAQDAAKSSLSDFAGRMTSFADTARAQAAGLLTGGLSTLTLEQQYAEVQQQYLSTVSAARGGDANAQANFAQIQSAFLTISQKVNAGDAAYAADFAAAVRNSNDLATWADGQADVAKASLDAMNKQVQGMQDLSQSMSGVSLGLAQLNSSLLNQPAFARPVDFSNYGTPAVEPLVQQIKALQEEVRALRVEQQQQTGAIITSNVQATVQAASQVVEGARSAAVEASYAARNGAVNLR